MVGKMARERRHIDGRPFGWEAREAHLTVRHREQILAGLGRGDTLAKISRGPGRAVSTVSRAVKRGGGCEKYSAAHRAPLGHPQRVDSHCCAHERTSARRRITPDSMRM